MYVGFWLSLSALIVGAVVAIVLSRHRTTPPERADDMPESAASVPDAPKTRFRRLSVVMRLLRGSPGVAPFRILVAAVAVAIYLLMFPIVALSMTADLWGWGNSIAATLYTTFQVFMANADINGPLDAYRSAVGLVTSFASFYAVLLFTIAPLMAVGFVLTFFQAFSAQVRYRLHKRSNVGVFSELNSRSISLARDLHEHEPKTVIVFAGVILADNEPSIDLIDRARSLGAICFKDDIQALPLHRHSKNSHMSFFVIGSDEEKDVWRAASIMRDPRYRDRKNTNLYLFSDTVESELALRYREGRILVRRINPARALIYDWLWSRRGDGPAGIDLFYDVMPKDRSANTVAPSGKDIDINAAVIGLGGHGLEMVKALAWFCQMDTVYGTFRLHLDAYDKDSAVASDFARNCPELASDRFNGPSPTVGHPRQDALYEIHMHGNVDATSTELTDRLLQTNRIKPLTFVFISLGDDTRNVRVATDIARSLARVGVHPRILVASSNSGAIRNAYARSMGPLTNIQVIGDLSDVYSYGAMIRSEAELNGLVSHLSWASSDLKTTVGDWKNNVKKFWGDEYYYSSSICVPIHWRARRALDIPGAIIDGSPRTDDQVEFLSRLEHARWCGYMRGEGFVYGKKNDVDVAMTHHDLVSFSELTLGDQKKDRNDSRDVLAAVKEKQKELVAAVEAARKQAHLGDNEIRELKEQSEFLADVGGWLNDAELMIAADLEETVERNRRLSAEDPAAYDFVLVRSLSSLGLLYQDMHRYQDAGAAFTEALQILNRARFGVLPVRR